MDKSKRLEVILKTMPDALFVMDNQGFYREVYAPADYPLVRPAEEYIGRHVTELLPPAEARHIINLNKKTLKEGRDISHYSLHIRGAELVFEMRRARLDAEHVLIIARNITDRQAAQNKIKTLLSEKELLLKEVHHRIKNNMNSIASILSMQAGVVKDEQTARALQDAVNRVRSMQIMYEKLYCAHSIQAVPLHDYLSELVDSIIVSHIKSRQIYVDKQFEEADIHLHTTCLFSLGIIINEIITNALQHAFLKQEKGTITIALKTQPLQNVSGDPAPAAGSNSSKQNDNYYNRDIEISITDDGCGIPSHIIEGAGGGFGMELIRQLAKQLDINMEITTDQGTCFRLLLPADFIAEQDVISDQPT